LTGFKKKDNLFQEIKNNEGILSERLRIAEDGYKDIFPQSNAVSAAAKLEVYRGELIAINHKLQ
jgi:hypothetical protein